MRQVLDQATHPLPLGLATGDILVHDDLRSVGKVAKLGFPDHDVVGIGKGVAVFKAQDSILREQRVVGDKFFLFSGTNVIEGNIVVLRILAHQHGMTVGKGASSDILPAESDGFAFQEEGSVGQQFSQRPVQPVFFDHGHPVAEDFTNLGKRVEGIRNSMGFGQDFHQDLPGYPCIGRRLGKVCGFDPSDPVPGALEIGGKIEAVALFRFFQLFLQLGFELCFKFFGHAGFDLSLFEQFFQIYFTGIGVFFDGFVQQRLCKSGLICLVVTVATVAEQVDKHIPVEGLPEFHGHFDGKDDGFYIISIDVKNGGLRYLGDVGTVGTGTGVDIVGRKSYLVVDDNVNGTPCFVAIQQGHLYHFVDYTLSGDGGISMNQDGGKAFEIAFVFAVYFGPGRSLDDRIDSLKVRGVGHQAEVYFALVAGGDVRRKAEVIFDVSLKDGLGMFDPFKFREYFVIFFVENIGQDVESSPVGHSNNELFDAEGRAFFNNGIEGRDNAFCSFGGETFLADVFGAEKLFENDGLVQFMEEVPFFLQGELRGIAAAFHFVPQPATDFRFTDVVVLCANRLAIGLLQQGDDIFQFGRSQAHIGTSLKQCFQVCRFESEHLDIQLGGIGSAFTNGIGFGEEVAPGTIVVDQIEDIDLFGSGIAGFTP